MSLGQLRMQNFFLKLEEEGIVFSDVEKKNIRVSFHQSGQIIYIDDFFIHSDFRRKGIGTKLFAYVLENIPKEIEMLQLFAADYEGNGNSSDFWNSVGFSYKYDSDSDSNMEYEARWTMIMGVNGHETPASIWYDEVD